MQSPQGNSALVFCIVYAIFIQLDITKGEACAVC